MFEFFFPTKVIFEKGAIKYLPEIVKALNKKNVFLLTGRNSMKRTGILSRVIKLLKKVNVSLVVYSQILPNPKVSIIEKASKVARESNADLIIGLGGGSVMDSAKGVSLMVNNKGYLWEYVTKRNGEKSPNFPSVDIIEIPTTAASGSELNCTAVFTNDETNDKGVLSNESLYPKVSLIDPELTLSVPEKTTVFGGIDIFCHLIEPYLTTKSSSVVTDEILEGLMKVVVDNLPKVKDNLNDIKAREALMWVSALACSQFADLGDGAGAMVLHGIEHPLSGFFGITHGEGLGCLLIPWVKFNISKINKRIKKLSKAIFNTSNGINVLKLWLKTVGATLRLREIGVKKDSFEKMAISAINISPWIDENPVKLDKKRIIEIYENAY